MLELFDFGYSQSKWVAEKIGCRRCDKHFPCGSSGQLVSPSVTGGGNNFWIAVRLVAFMVNHGIGVDALNQVSFVPADIVANNIVAISTTPNTVNKTFHVVRDDYANMLDITSFFSRPDGNSRYSASPTSFPN